MANTPEEANSIKGLFQGLVPDPGGVVQGTVTSVSPLNIKIEGDDKLVLTETTLIVPRHLTNHTVMLDISGGTINAPTDSKTHSHEVSGNTDNNSHSHLLSGSTGNGGDPSHSHGLSGSTGSDNHSHSVSGTSNSDTHSHALVSFAVAGATMTVYNALKVGDKVHLLSFNAGKQYYVLDKVV